MRIIILEDYPERLVETVKQLSDICPEKCEVEVLFYNPQNESEAKMKELSERLSCPIIVVDYWNFEEKLNELYSDSDTLFLFDTDINRSAPIEEFTYRINVRYALKKREETEEEPYRIWFYTSVESLKPAVRRTFKEFAIEAEKNGAMVDIDLEGCPTFCAALGLHQTV